MGTAVQPGDYVYAIASFDDGDGERLYAGGTIVDDLVWWDGDRWQPVEGYQGGSVFWLEVIDDGRGPALYIAADDVFRYDGNEFEMLGPANYFKEVHALAWLDDGYDARLLAADGLYPDPDRLSEWDGVSWSQLGGDFDERVRTLAVFDHGTGPSVYAGGNFHRVGDVMSEHFARWDPPQVPCEEPTPVPAVSSLGAAVIVITLTAGLVYASRPKRCTRLQRSH